jgi:hypothetical protein
MSAWPTVVARLVEHLPSLPGWADVAVFDGPKLQPDDPFSFVTVAFVEGEDFGGSFEQSTPESWPWEEAGTVRSELVVWSGDEGQSGIRARAFDLFGAWQDWVVDDHTLGVLSPSSTASLAVDVQPVQNTAGAAQRLTVTLSYLARP